MNPVDQHPSAPLRSVTAQYYDASARAARWKDWFRLATCVLIGEPLASRWVDLFFLYWFSVKRRMDEKANALLPRVSVLV
jgi:hypothetical protein